MTTTPSHSHRRQFATVPTSKLRAGVTLQTPIYEVRDGRSVLLLAAGSAVTPQLLTRLEQRGISQVRMQHSEFLRMSGAGGAPGDGVPALPELRVRGGKRFAVSSESFRHRVQRHGASSYRPETRQNFVESYAQSMDHVDGLFGELATGGRVDGRAFADTASESLARLTQDFDLFVALGVEPEMDHYPVRHSVQTAMLATAIGATLGLSEKELLDLSVGCLVHDVGMLHIDPALYEAERVLDDIEFLEITKHPTIAFDLVRDVRDLSTGVRMVVYQMHERCNATGYPRRRDARSIHPLAKVAALADVFLALISHRPHRPGMLPYSAIEQIIQDAHQGLFDPDVVRGLLHTVSLFPIGSYVETSDGRIARVVRANSENFTRPVIEPLSPGPDSGEPAVIDLAAEATLRIVRPVAEPASGDSAASATDSATEIDFWE